MTDSKPTAASNPVVQLEGSSALSGVRPACVLSYENVRELLQISPTVALIERALAEFSAGSVVNPLRTVLYAGASDRYVGVMPAFFPFGRALGAKLVTSFAANKLSGLPSHFATIVLLDEQSGALRGIIDGRHITEVRTAAVTAVACRHLARRPPRVVAILGAGVQARGHLEVLDATFTLEEVRIWSPSDGVERLVEEMSPRLRCAVVQSSCAEQAIQGADVVVLVTDSAEPVLRADWVAAGTLVASVGACRPDHRELDPELLARAWLVVDSRVSAMNESGDVIMGLREQRFGPDHIRGELGDVILGRVLPRSSDDDVVVFKSLGLAVEDVAIAALVCGLAEARGTGQRVRL